MHVAARPDVVEAPKERWQSVARLILDRRTRLGIGQEELAVRTGRLASRAIVTALERATQGSYRRRSLVGIARGLGWDDDAIERHLVDGTMPEERPTSNGSPLPDVGRLREMEAELTLMREEQATIRNLLERVARHLGLGSLL